MKRKTDDQPNHFGTYPTAHFLVKVTDGRLKEIGTDNFLEFVERTEMKIIIKLIDLKQEVYKRVADKDERVILPKNSKLRFEIKGNYGWETFHIELKEQLIYSKKNNKPSVIKSSKCFLIESNNTREYIGDRNFDSINQAFMKLSIFLNPNGKFHNCNVYEKFQTENGLPLKKFRF